jgi:hypothetical protein
VADCRVGETVCLSVWGRDLSRDDAGATTEPKAAQKSKGCPEARGGLIGIGRGLTASPLPHHRTYGSRIRRFGRLSQGEPSPQPQPPPQSASSQFIPDAGRTA